MDACRSQPRFPEVSRTQSVQGVPTVFNAANIPVQRAARSRHRVLSVFAELPFWNRAFSYRVTPDISFDTRSPPIEEMEGGSRLKQFRESSRRALTLRARPQNVEVDEVDGCGYDNASTARRRQR